MATELPKVLVIGSGGVGTIAALSLTLNGKTEVTMVVRSAYEQVMKDGYTVKLVTYGSFDNWRPHHVSSTVEKAESDHGPFDFLVLTTKNIPDGSMTCEQIIAPAVSKKTTIVLVQNGIGIDEPMKAAFPENILLLGILLIGSTLKGTLVDNIYKDQLILSPFANDGHSHEEVMSRVNLFAELYKNADPEVNYVRVEENSKKSRWEKLVYNAVLNTICALTGLDVNRCQIAGANKDLFMPAMKEVVAIAASEGINLDDEICYKMMHIGDGLFYAPSMLVDLNKKQLCEVEVILGYPLKFAERNGVYAPILSTVYQLLKIKQLHLKEEKGMITINLEDFQGYNSDDYPQRLEELQKK